MPYVDYDFDALLAAGVCECGVPLDDHPPLPKPKPWDAGRPCAKTVLERGHGWDGRPAVEHGPGSRNRWNGYGTGLRSTAPAGRVTRSLTARQSEILRIFERNGRNQAATARETGISAPSVSAILARIRKRGVET